MEVETPTKTTFIDAKDEKGFNLSSFIGAASFKSRIFRRIAAGVFFSILLIEIALLVYSWFSERQRLIVQLDETLVTLTSTLSEVNPVPQLEHILKNQSANTNYKIIGFLHSSDTGVIHEYGDSEGLVAHSKNQQASIFEQASGIYIRQLPDNQALWLKVDASWIKTYMQDYVVRIIGMVLLISAFVTGTALIFLRPILINPLLRLHNLLIWGKQNGLDMAVSDKRDLTRNDEIGSVFRSLDELRIELIGLQKDSKVVSDRFEELANLGADCFWEIDSKQQFTYVAGDTNNLFSMHPEAIQGLTHSQLLSKLEHRLPDSQSIYPSLRKDGQWEGKIYCEDVGNKISATIRIIASPQYNDSNRLTGFRGTLKDISKENALAEELHYQATHDELTGLNNRRELNTQLAANVEQYQTSGKVFSLMTLSIDNFKAVNDAAGQAAGDLLLIILAEKFSSRVGEQDKLARIGGDEFAIILSNSDLDSAKHIAESIRSTVDDLIFFWESKPHKVSVSIGIAEISESLSTEEGILFASGSCCTEAKHNGKNQIMAYSESISAESVYQADSEWISRILLALQNDSFNLYKQSIRPLDPNEVEEHFEILIRMENPDGGLWFPDMFLPVAERNELMPKIDQWVVENALKWLQAQNIEQDQNYCMNINLSALSLSDKRFREMLVERSKANRELNQFVCYELTESAAMTDYENIVALLLELKSLGCRIALDDFGIGFSSLSQIQTLPLDYIKIDGSFVKEVLTSELDQALIKSVVNIAEVLNIRTVAEFVENEAVLEKLISMNIDYGQGYHFAKPEPLIIDSDGKSSTSAAA